MKTLLFGVAAILAASTAGPKPGDWPAWRGPSGNGSTLKGEFPTKWTPQEAAWSVELPGMGVSTPIVWQNRIYLTTPSDGQDSVLALDAAGKQLWLTKLGAESPARHTTLGSSCNASPVTDGKGLFVRYRSGRMAALNLDGSVRWQFNLVEKYGPEELYWDQGSSPVVTDQFLILSRMHHGESFLAGFDKQTGEQKWLVKRNYPCPAENDNGYSTPVLFNYKGKQALLLWGADRLTAHSATDGSLLWSCAGFNPAGTVNWPAIATPVVVNGMAVAPVGRDDRPQQAHMHGIKVDGSGDVTETNRVWQRDDVGVFVCTPAEYKGKVYLLRHRGGVVCLDPATGKTVWQDAFPRASGSFYASPVIGNGILYAAREDGTVFAARVEDHFELLSENAMGERIVSSPTLANNSVLIRGVKHLFCIAAKR
jgi:outer membrane protein assembly factor BamB